MDAEQHPHKSCWKVHEEEGGEEGELYEAAHPLLDRLIERLDGGEVRDVFARAGGEHGAEYTQAKVSIHTVSWPVRWDGNGTDCSVGARLGARGEVETGRKAAKAGEDRRGSPLLKGTHVTR